MRIAVVGAGAIGGWMAVRLAQSGQEISVFARGETLDAVRRNGLRLTANGDTHRVDVAAGDDASALGPQDLVVVGVKGTALAEVAPAIAAMLGPQTAILPAMNGVPWWFTHGLGGVLSEATLTAVDPDGRISAMLPPERVVGCVVHASGARVAPGHAIHQNGNRFIIGEPLGIESTRLAQIRETLAAAGFDVETSGCIHMDIWYKLWGNMTMNPISALTGALTDRILDDDLVRAFALSVMNEAAEIGRHIGCPISESGLNRMQLTRKLGAIKTSMLQDAEAGRPLEIDALLGAPREIAAKTGVATPYMDALHGLVRLYATASLA